MRPSSLPLFLGLILGGLGSTSTVPHASAQVPDVVAPAPVQAPAPLAPAPGGGGENNPAAALGNSVLPLFGNSNSDLFLWSGKNWNINDQRLFQARFEKYLNSPEEEEEADKEYRAQLQQIIDILAPARLTNKSVDEAFRLLPAASAYDMDAKLCEGIADAVYSAWRTLNHSQRLAQANTALEEERRRHEWNAQVVVSNPSLSATTSRGSKDSDYAKELKERREAAKLPYTTRLIETLASIKANQIKKELSELQVKIEFQGLIIQLFVQRRFQHVLIANRFYRNIFSDGDTTLHLGTDSKDLFSKTTGNPPTISTLDTLANEAIRDVRESILAYNFLVDKNELESATKRLAEAFTIGEYLPELRTLPRERKRLALRFTQKSNQLLSSLLVKDYGLAEKLVKELEKEAIDFDNSKPMAAIETARTVSAMHLAKARNAAVSGDKTTLEIELKAATEIWPRNPALADIGGRIFDSADIQQKALSDLDQLLSQRNYRQIFDDRLRFIAASALYPERQEQLKKVLEDMQTIESTLIRATEIARHGDAAGAWESVETVFKKYPDDNKLNQMRANLTTEASEFVRTLKTAQDLEGKGQTGASLAWYLRAQKLYPASEMSQNGINRLVGKIFPNRETRETRETPEGYSAAK